MALINVIFVAFGMYNWIFNDLQFIFNYIFCINSVHNQKIALRGKEKIIIFWFMLCYFGFFL